MKTEVVHHASDVTSELAKLDLTLEPLLNAGSAWLLALSNWTPNHPRIYKGLSAWAEAVKTLRDGLVPLNWERSEERNYPLTVHPSAGTCIAIASGDHDTGLVQGSPKNKVPKGPRTAELVELNSLQGDLFMELPLPSSVAEPKEHRLTYILLVYVDSEKEEVRSELSVPMDMNKEGLITAWKQRILLPAIPFGGDPDSSRTPKTPELDIEVKRKAA